MSNKKIANVFNDGAAVTIKATATKPNGDGLPQAGQRGTIASSPKPGRYMVDVPGFPLVNLPADELEPAAQATPAKAAAPGAGHTPESPGPAAQAYAFDVLPLAMIVASLTNPRTTFDQEELESLAGNIATDGLLQPILVRPLPGSRLQETFTDRRAGDPRPTHEVVAGERRFRACAIAGVRTMPVMVRHLTDEQVLRMQLMENVQRSGLHALEEAQGYRRILDLPSQAEKTMAQRTEELSAEIKKSTRYIYQTLQLLQLCDFTKKVFLEKKLHRTIALEIAKIGNEAGQIEATRVIAGLARSGDSTEVVEHPMSHSEAQDYVKDNHSLELKKAPFPIKVVIAEIEACTTCSKNSDNARDLFDEGDKSGGTCLDRSCYGKKNTAHHKALAEAAKEKGQRVVSGVAAKKAMPYSYNDDTDLEGGYTALNEKQYGVGMDGKTVAQLLGKDRPLPILIENPHKPGFVEAYLTTDLQKLFKERGIGGSSQVNVSKHKQAERDDAKKDKAEKEWRWTWAEALLSSAGEADALDLLDNLVVPAAIQLYRRLDNECTKRTHKLMKWDFSPFGWDDRAKLTKHFKELPAAEMNKFIVCACVAGELHVAQYFKPSTTGLDTISELLKVDGKAIKVNLAAAAKAEEKEKAERAKGKQKALAAKTTAKPAAAVAPGTLTAGARVRFKEGIKGPAGHFRKCCGKAGNVSSISGRDIFVKLDGVKDVAKATRDELEVIATAPKLATPPAPVKKTQWRDFPKDEALAIGSRVRIKHEAALQSTKKAYAGDVGTLEKRMGVEIWAVLLPTSGKKPASISFHFTEFQVEVTAAPAAAAPVAEKKIPGKSAKKLTAADQQDLLAPQPSKTLNPQSAWPFPIGAETPQQAQARSSKALKGART